MNVLHLVIIISTTLITIGLVMNFPSGYADTSTIKIFPKYIAVFQLNQTHDGFVYFENKTNSIFDNENKTGFVTNVNNKFDIPVGHYDNFDYVMTILFDSNEITKSDWLDTVTINSIQLNMFIDYSENYTANKTFVTADYCLTDPRDRTTEKALEKNSNEVFEAKPTPEKNYADVCSALDSIVTEKNELPKTYSMDLTSAAGLINKTDPIIEFNVFAFPIAEKGSVLDFFSYRSTTINVGFGLNSVPSITLTYTTEPTFLGYVRDLIYKQPADLVAVFSIIIPAIVWFYRKEIRRKMKGSRKPAKQVI